MADLNTHIRDNLSFLKAAVDPLPAATWKWTNFTSGSGSLSVGVDSHTTILFGASGTVALDVSLTGLVGGVDGRVVIFQNCLGHGKTLSFQHLAGTVGQQFENLVTSAPTLVGPGGAIAYVFSTNRWRYLWHEQGAWITPAYAGADFTASAGTWTVDSGDRLVWKYKLVGNMLHVKFFLVTTSFSVTPAELRGKIPGGFTAVSDTNSLIQVSNSGAAAAVGMATASGTNLVFYSTIGGGGWTPASTNNTTVNGSCAFEVA